jgi:hypothetical protein
MSLELLEAGFNNPPSGLSARARVVLVYAWYRCKDHRFYERLPRVAKRTGLSLATVKRAIKELRSKGLLKFEEGGGGAACVYLVELQTSVNSDPGLKETRETSVNPDPGLTQTDANGETSVNSDPGGSVNSDSAPGSTVTLPLDKNSIRKKKISSARAREAPCGGASPPRNGNGQQEVVLEGVAGVLAAAADGELPPVVASDPSSSGGSDYDQRVQEISRRARKLAEADPKARPRRGKLVPLVGR